MQLLKHYLIACDECGMRLHQVFLDPISAAEYAKRQGWYLSTDLQTVRCPQHTPER